MWYGSLFSSYLWFSSYLILEELMVSQILSKKLIFHLHILPLTIIPSYSGKAGLQL